jgi:hypothetical protein
VQHHISIFAFMLVLSSYISGNAAEPRAGNNQNDTMWQTTMLYIMHASALTLTVQIYEQHLLLIFAIWFCMNSDNRQLLNGIVKA